MIDAGLYVYLGGMLLVGDATGDGLDDILVGAEDSRSTNRSNLSGRVYLFPGSEFGLPNIPSWKVTLPGLTSITIEGPNHMALGDVNGDGYTDLLVGSLDNRTFLFFGGPGGSFSASPSWKITYHEPGNSFFGMLVALGDVNGDGYAEIAVSDPAYPCTGDCSFQSYAYAGKVYVFLGTPIPRPSGPFGKRP